jgi:hypothetical protein
MRILAGVEDLVQRIEYGHTQVGYSVVRRSGDAVCGLYHAQEDEEHVFLALASKPRWTVCQWFGLKTIGTGLVI